MKKVLSIALITMLILSFGTMTAFAETVGTGSKDIDVKGKYVDGVTTPTVYSIDLTWGAMEFTYNAGGTNDWNPANHDYDINTTASWSASGNTITVTNHSNADVIAGFAYEKATGFEAVDGMFDNSSINVLSAVGTAVGSAKSGTVTLTLSGTLTDTATNFTKVGTITVTLS